MFPRPTSAPAAEPLTLAEATAHLKEVADGGEIDAKISRLITTARTQCETRTGRVLITTPQLLTLPDWPCLTRTNPLGMIDLKTGPLIAVQSVQYLDAAGALQPLPDNQYRVYTHLSTGQIGRAYGVTWPTLRDEVLDAVRIAFTAGYGDTAASVPEPLREWMLCAIQHMYDKRGWDVPDEFAPGLINPYRLWGVTT
jgi:uncharacterized phiE125 gp8 family phage protein